MSRQNSEKQTHTEDSQATRLAEVVSILKDKGISQKHICREIHLSESHFSEVKRGHRALSSKVAVLIEQAFGVSANWLLGGMGGMWARGVLGDVEGGKMQASNVSDQAGITDLFKDSKDAKMVIIFMGAKCPSCRSLVEHGTKVCAGCGTFLKWPKIEPSG